MSKNLIQEYKMADISNRGGILGDFLEKSLQAFLKRNGVDNVGFLTKLNKEAQGFINRPLMRQDNPFINWSLSDNWFRELFSQALKGVDDKMLKRTYKLLGWSYKKSLNPKGGNGVTLHTMDFSDVITDANEIVIKLVNRESFPIDTVLINNKSGNEWEVTGCDSVKYELVNEYGLSIYRTSPQIYRNFKELV